MLYGIDISSYQPNIDWPLVRKGKGTDACEYVIVKATEGNGSVNALFETQVLAAKAAGCLVGAYHFARPNGTTAAEIEADAKDEAQKCLARLSDIEAKLGHQLDLPLFLDLERNTPLTKEEIPRWRQWAEVFVQVFKDLNRPIGIYGSKFFLLVLQFSAAFADLPLWCAAYPVSGTPAAGLLAPIPWANWTFWQFAGDGKGTWPGIAGSVDVNCFAGSLEDLYVFCGIYLRNTPETVHVLQGSHPPTEVESNDQEDPKEPGHE